MFTNFFLISGIFLTLTCFILLIIILRSSKNFIHLIWFLFNVSVMTWGMASFFMTKETPFEIALAWIKIGHIGIIFIGILFYHVIYIFCGLRHRLILIACYAQGIFFLFLDNINLFIRPQDVKVLFNQFYYVRTNYLPYILFVCIWLLIICYGLYRLFMFYLKSSQSRKNQIMYFFFGYAIGFSGGITNFLPVFNLDIYPIGNFTITLYCIAVTYAIVKHRLLDIKTAITRTGIFFVVYSIVLGIPFALAFGFHEKLYGLLQENWWIIPLISSTILATVGPFVYIFLNKKAEDKILFEQKKYQNILKDASRGMIRIKNLDLLTKLIVYVVAKTVKIKHVSIYLLDQGNQYYKLCSSRTVGLLKEKLENVDIDSPLICQLSSKSEPIVTEEVAMNLQENSGNFALLKLHKQLIELHASLAVPSFVENRLIGILILGEKRSGKPYSQDDIAVFSVLANQAALAIENAQFYDEIKQTHEQLFQAEKMATIGTMADGLSHQINNRFHALSLIAGDSLDMLKAFDWSGCNEGTKQVMADLKSALERIENNVLQGGEIVKGILKYSRPGEGGFESVEFKDVLNGAIEMVQYKIKLKEIDIVQNFPVDLPKLHGNLTQLQEVFFNLIDNAYDAIKERQMTLKEEGYRGKIEVTACRSSSSMEIRVTDNGMGVKDPDKKKLFTPFFTTKATAKKGTGLGLYVIEKIIASHNGKIDIESEYKSGTRFIINLPTNPSAT